VRDMLTYAEVSYLPIDELCRLCRLLQSDADVC
jgi:hypothetical protein